MKSILKLEEIAMFCISIWVYQQSGQSWWLFAALFFLPDLGMLGYLKNEKVGAWIYNLFHHKGLALVLFGIGFLWKQEPLLIAGIILFSHASFDRIFGYGLKYEEGFKFTHLGKIGKEA